MGTSLYFNNFKSSGEQRLIEDLIIESIKIYGVDNYYVPRKIVATSNTFIEAQVTEFGNALSMEMYVKNIDGFEGDGEFLSSFGVEVREQITFALAVRSYNQQVGSYLNRDRPLEGDLIWFPFTSALYQIKYVNLKPVFYQLGALQFYDIVCELFEYNNEVFNTGIDEIDSVYNAFSTSTVPYDILTESGLQLLTENGKELLTEEYSILAIDPLAQNQEFANSVLSFLDFTHVDPFSESALRIL